MFVDKTRAYVFLFAVFVVALGAALYFTGAFDGGSRAPELILSSQARSESLESHVIVYSRIFRYAGDDGKTHQLMPNVVIKSRKGGQEKWEVYNADNTSTHMYKEDGGVVVCEEVKGSSECVEKGEGEMREFLYYTNADTLRRHVADGVVEFGGVTNSSVGGRECDGFTGKVDVDRISESDLQEHVFGSFVDEKKSVGDFDFWVCYDRETGLKSELLVSFEQDGKRTEVELKALQIEPNAEIDDEAFRIPKQ